ncbi:MAG: class IV adenylate cyclase [Phycisphaerae bacterium]|nr:class IV adenylate cyclase [Phycisphaerae bacterium]
MHTEIETKLKVDSLDAVKQRLIEMSAEFIEEQRQIDHYLDDAKRMLTAEDKCLRLRFQQAGDEEKIFVTYKGAKFAGEIKKRTEIEFGVDNFQAAQDMFLHLGFVKVLEVAKVRQLWRLGECEVALDAVAGLGTFVEIEGEDAETIGEVKQSLGLSDVVHIMESYAHLLESKMRKQ